MITWTFLSAFIGVLVLLALPAAQDRLAKWIALTVSIVGLVIAASACVIYSLNPEPFQFSITREWIPALGISFRIGADGISLVMLLLTGVIAVAGVLFSWNIEHRPRAFFAFFLTIIGGVYGVFQSFDLFLLFVFYEIVIVPKYFLIAIWGSTNREYGAMKLTIYSVAASALVLLALIGVYAVGGTFDLFALQKAGLPVAFQLWALPVLFVGFAVLAGMWPFHTWAPTGHVAAPTAASMLLAGVVMKLGSYAALRVAMPLLPEGVDYWRIAIVVLAGIGIVYAGFVALAQQDLKFVVGYSSISHMGFVILGLMTLNGTGLSGAVLQMFSHGIIAGLLFAIVGRMVYDRTHTRVLTDLGAMRLSKSMPFATVVFIVATAASMGLPGFSGFVAELSVLIGAWQAFPWMVAVAGVGVLVTAAFSLRALQQSFFGNTAELALAGPPEETETPHASHAAMPRITTAEICGAALLVACALGVGLYPQPFFELIQRGLATPLMEGIIAR